MDKSEIEDLIGRALVCRLGLADEGEPYVVPMSFGYEDGTLYFHGGAHGRKIEMLKKNPRVCFEIDVDVAIVPHGQPCKAAVRYRSVIGFGTASFIEDREQKKKALSALMRQYTDREYEFPDETVDRTTCFKVEIESMTGKQSGFGE